MTRYLQSANEHEGRDMHAAIEIPKSAHPVYGDIAQALAGLDEALGKYEHTTHGSLFRDGSLSSVANALVQVEKRPCAYSISELSQVIRAYLKR